MLTQPTLKCPHNNPDTCMCGGAVYRRLPLHVTELRCKCEEPTWRSYSRIGIASIGYHCSTCGKPHPFTLVNHHWTCDGCGKYFTQDYRTFPEVPDPGPISSGAWKPKDPKYLLCKECDVPVALPRRRGTRIRFHTM